MTRYPNLLPALMTVSLLQTSVVLSQDVLTIMTSSPYVFNGTLQYDLTCTVSPLKAMTFRWEGIDCNQREKLIGGDRCKFTPSQSNNGLTVMCIATYGTNGSSSEISNITTLNVQYPPSTPPDITTNIIGGTMYVGQNYQLTCTIVGGNPLPTMYFGCVPTSPFHHEEYHFKEGYTYFLYDINPAVLNDDGGVCKCTGRWSPQPAVYPLSASVTLRVVDLNGSAILSTSRTTLSGRNSSLSASETVTFTPISSSLSASETVTFTPRTSLMTSSKTSIPDNKPDDQQSNVFIGIGIMGALLLAAIIIGAFGLRMILSKREKKPKQNGAAPSEGPDIIDLNGSAVLSTNRTTLSGRTSSLSASETVTFTPRTSSMTSGYRQSEHPYDSIISATTVRNYSPSHGTTSGGTTTGYENMNAPVSSHYYLEPISGSSTTGGDQMST